MPTYEDIAFKVIVKNDGISDIIFKTLMLKGEAGGTISSIEKTSSVGVVDTYTITLNDGTTTTFEVTNGSNIASIEKTATAGLIDTYTVTLTNGDTSTFEVKNGEDAQLYELPQNCVVGYDKEPTQVTETYYERYISLDDVNGISSVKYAGNTLQETNDGRNLLEMWSHSGGSYNPSIGSIMDLTRDSVNDFEVSNNSFTCNLGSAWATESVISDITGQSSLHLKFTFNGTSGFRFTRGFLDSDKKVLDRYNLTDITGSVNVNLSIPSGAKYFYIVFTSNTANTSFTITEPQLEAGSSATPYQPYCGGIPSPNPSYPQEIVGVGEKQQDNTYSVDLVAEDADGNVYTVTASGLTHPVYSGDWIDLVAGVLHRGTGYKVLNGSENWIQGSYAIRYFTLFIDEMLSGNRMIGFSDHFKCTTEAFNVEVNNSIRFGWSNKYINICSDSFTDMSAFQTWLSNNNTIITYPLATPTEESITLTGDLEQVKRIRGEYAYIDAPLYASTEITFGQETDFPDGYEEIDFPLDDMFYYQDGEYIDFPKNWGFVMGYVFDADNIRFVMNVTKQLKEGMIVAITRSADLSLNTYAGAGDVGILSGFSANSVSWIPELGQIQINLTTSQPHGLPSNMLLGARVATGVLRIIFEEEET